MKKIIVIIIVLLLSVYAIGWYYYSDDNSKREEFVNAIEDGLEQSAARAEVREHLDLLVGSVLSILREDPDTDFNTFFALESEHKVTLKGTEYIAKQGKLNYDLLKKGESYSLGVRSKTLVTGESNPYPENVDYTFSYVTSEELGRSFFEIGAKGSYGEVIMGNYDFIDDALKREYITKF